MPARGQEGCEPVPFRPFVNDNAKWDSEAAVASWLSEYMCCRFLSPDLCCVGMYLPYPYSQKIAYVKPLWPGLVIIFAILIPLCMQINLQQVCIICLSRFPSKKPMHVY